MRSVRFAAFLMVAILATGDQVIHAATANLDDCEARFAAAPERRESAACFAEAGLNYGVSAEAEQRIERLLAESRQSPQAPPALGRAWLLFYLGRLRWAEPSRAEAPYRSAAAVFAELGEVEGEVLSRIALHSVLMKLGRPQEAEAEVAHVAAISRRAGDPLLVARSQVLEAKHLRLQGSDLERAYLLLHRARDAAFGHGGSFSLQRDCLEELATVSHSIGRLAEERTVYRDLAEIAARAGERRTEAIARYGGLRILMGELGEVPRHTGRDEAIRLARDVLSGATAVGYTELAGRAHVILGRLSGKDEARVHLKECLADLPTAKDRSLCLAALAERQRLEGELSAAGTSIQTALALSVEAKDPWSRADVWREKMRWSWQALPRDQALADARSALGAVETIRERQPAESSRAGLSARWSEDYYWLSGRLLEAGGTTNTDEAFAVMERLRARTLVEALEAAQAAPSTAPSPWSGQAAAVLEQIAQVQRRLLDPGLAARERALALADLRRLELEEADISDRSDAARGIAAFSRRDSSLVLPQVRRALHADEALLSFQVAPDETVFGDFGGGSWLLVATRNGTRTIRLHRDRVALRPAVALFNGLFERRDGSETRPATRLYEDLLAEAFAFVPPGVRRLVIIADDVLHRLPFGALRSSQDHQPLVHGYEISVVPSATLWLRWRSSTPNPAVQPLLALADPELPASGAGRVSTERAAVFADAVRLGALPFARQEGRSAVQQLAAGSILRVGKDASEGFVKQVGLHRFGILHFATHAVVDDERPQRSGVLLTADPASEDGLLQIREIVRLPLAGRVVVLSSCRSASGQMLRGEGVIGLARAFFQAGAHAVVASLWPLRDDDGAALFDRFYTHLATGQSVAGALRAAQRDRSQAGAPAYAWAGVVLLGDGDLIPLPGGRRGVERTSQERTLLVLAVLVVLGVLAVSWLQGRRRSRVSAKI